MGTAEDGRSRWTAFIAICLGLLMIVLNGAVVYVALPAIRKDFGLTGGSLVWVASAYTLTYGGFVLLGGRLADVYGQRRVFLTGIAWFALTSLACGLSTTNYFLVAFRGVQGLGGALVVSTVLSLLVRTFPDETERAKAMGILSFVTGAGSSVGFLLGGVVTSALNWHWIFLVNLPVGAVVFVLVLYLLPKAKSEAGAREIDLLGAVTVTASLVFLTYGIIGARGGRTTREAWPLVTAALLVGTFLVIERRVDNPLVPLNIFQRRNFAFSSIVSFLWGMGGSSLFFVGLYMQAVLGRDAMQAGLAFLPMSGTAAVFSMGLCPMIVTRYGLRRPLTIGMSVAAFSLALLARMPVAGSLLTDVVPNMILYGLGIGLAGSPLQIFATRDAGPGEYGLASGLFGTTSLVGGTLGLAVLTALSSARTDGLVFSGASPSAALAQGYRLALLCGAGLALLAALIGGTFLRSNQFAPTRR
jgi:EmrB/QacA subfamily drug resistance transporter